MKKNILTIALFLTVSKSVIAQDNTSYNTNTIPIGGQFSCAFGSGALSVNGGNFNTANGYQALYSNTIGVWNTAIGTWALEFNTEGGVNTACGANALHFNTTGGANTAIGYSALINNITGSGNTANGNNALLRNNASWNTAMGNYTLSENTTGSSNTAVGTFSLLANSIGSNNTAIGFSSLSQTKTGNNCVAIGDSAGFSNTGSSNIYLGKRAGYYETGNNKLYIGTDSNKTILFGDMSTGQLLLGNQQPNGYSFKGMRTLNVLGGILADSVRVALSSNWADYVFADNYRLKSLTELENFIRTNKHLPNIPSAEEAANDGIELASMNTKLLEKIEELTLYILQQQKEMQLQQNDNNLLKKKVEQNQSNYCLLQQQVAELKMLVVKPN